MLRTIQDRTVGIGDEKLEKTEVMEVVNCGERWILRHRYTGRCENRSASDSSGYVTEPESTKIFDDESHGSHSNTNGCRHGRVWRGSLRRKFRMNVL